MVNGGVYWVLWKKQISLAVCCNFLSLDRGRINGELYVFSSLNTIFFLQDTARNGGLTLHLIPEIVLITEYKITFYRRRISFSKLAVLGRN